MLGRCTVYHFISKTFQKLSPELNRKHGQDIFYKKWGITVENFRNNLNLKQKFEIVK